MEENYNDSIVPIGEQNLDINENKQFQYHGQNGDFFIIYLKNMFLTFITLGLYYPWAKVEILKYHYQNTQLDDSRFQFTGTGKEVFKGFIKVYGFVVLFYMLLFMAASSDNKAIIGIGLFLFYIAFILLIPFAIHGAIRYRSSRSIYNGIHFKYIAKRFEFFKLFFGNLLLTIFTFGIYGSWMQVNLREYIYKNLKFGNVSFKFNGKGGDLFILTLIGTLLSMITMGIYMFWYQKDLIKFYIDNTRVIQDGKESRLKINISAGDVFRLVVINMLIVVFTFGLGAPIAVIRTMKFMYNNMELKGSVNMNSVNQGNTDDYDDASGDDFLDFLDIDLL